MNILLAGQAYYRRDNGQAVFTINLAEGLAGAGHHVLVLAPSATRRSERWQERGVQIQTVPTLPLFNNTNVTAFAGGVINATLEQFQPDVV
ncbi:MAG: glycosyltransferase, partial [Caldilineaceae bacterium]|nr:glycosyltransferase [Caldilineaceae bacterium]